jgi:D-beta-D-heptose 7-phosphate kinase/D-beta-D-heptose 1-phosphate adenosyltransferase
MSPDELSSLLSKFERCTIMVIGDVMLDEYLWGHVQRISPEAPVPIFNLSHEEHTLGGAGNVVKNLRSLGATVIALGAVGADPIGKSIVGELDRLGVDREGVIEDGSRGSTRKTRLMSLEHGQQVFRLDKETAVPVSPATENALLRTLADKVGDANAIICSDYMKGVLTPPVLQTAIESARKRHTPVVVGPKHPDPARYRGATYLIPNLRELEQLSGVRVDGPESIDEAARLVIGEAEIGSLLVTRGSAGMSLFERAPGGIRRIDIPTVARTVYDVTGAGDTVASVFTLAIAAGTSGELAARLGTLAAGLVVGKRGTTSVTPSELMQCVHQQFAADPAFSYSK